MTARVAPPSAVPDDCPGGTGEVVPLGTVRRVGRTDVNRDLDETPPVWAATAVAQRRALAALRRTARTFGADGVVGITFGTDERGGVAASGVTVRRRLIRPGEIPDEPFTTHLPLVAADLAVEAGMPPRRLVVTAVRAALHDPLDTWPEPAALAHGELGTLDHLVGAARDAADDAWRSAGRRRGPATVVVGDVAVTGGTAECTRLDGMQDAAVVLVATSTVLAGAADRSSRALELAEALDRIVVPLGAPA